SPDSKLFAPKSTISCPAAVSRPRSSSFNPKPPWSAAIPMRMCLLDSPRCLLLPKLAVTADQVVGRAIVRERRLGSAFKLRDDALCQDLAEFHAPLIERVDVPDNTLGKDRMFVESNQRTQ